MAEADAGDRTALAGEVLHLAHGLGFALAGIAAAQPSPHAEAHAAFIAAGKHGGMEYLARHLADKQDPRRLLAGCRSILVVADPYAAAIAPAPAGHGRFARYALGDDYHLVLKERLHALADALRRRHPQAEFRATTDTAPIHEREFAALAGLGWIGKNTLLIHPRHGSFLLLGTLLTTLDLAASAELGWPAPTTPPTDHCANCRRCIDACPTQAIAAEGRSMDPRRCISYLTLEHRGPIGPEWHAPMGAWLGGCDICQEVCPYNAVGARNPLPVQPAYAPRSGLAGGLALVEVLAWTDEERRQVFRRSALKRMKLEMLLRNALIAAGNALTESPDPALRAAVERHAAGPEGLLRETAWTVLGKLDAPQPPR